MASCAPKPVKQQFMQFICQSLVRLVCTDQGGHLRLPCALPTTCSYFWLVLCRSAGLEMAPCAAHPYPLQAASRRLYIKTFLHEPPTVTCTGFSSGPVFCYTASSYIWLGACRSVSSSALEMASCAAQPDQPQAASHGLQIKAFLHSLFWDICNASAGLLQAPWSLASAVRLIGGYSLWFGAIGGENVPLIEALHLLLHALPIPEVGTLSRLTRNL